MRWIFNSFRFKNEFSEFIPSLALVSVVSAASKSVFTECREKPVTKSFRSGYGRTQCTSSPESPLSCYPAVRIYIRFTLKTALKLTSARMLLAISLADSANIAA